jgi:hypothetical protein
MAYSHYSLKKVVQQFGLTLAEEREAFGLLPPCALAAEFTERLALKVPLAVAINTEKARSELIVAEILFELRQHFKQRISFFSGVEFDVDREAGLTGFCDFLVSLSPEQLFVTAPVIAVVEAKNDNLPAAFGQCLAEMVGAQRFNQTEDNRIESLYGVVTSGVDWMFLRLKGTLVTVDLGEYGIDQPERVFGILAAMIEQRA